MKKMFLATVLGAAMLLPAAANAAVAYLTDSAVLRAGPGHDFPRIERLPPNARVELYGCIDRFDWCDVRMGPIRGWLDGDRLFMPWRGRRVPVIEYGPQLSLPLLSFRFDDYWGEHYRGRDFYRDRERFRGFADRNHDGVPDRFEHGPGGRPPGPGRRDEDHDGIPNRVDRDRDGDGVPNRYDRRPDDRRRD